jgi:Aspartyl protease
MVDGNNHWEIWTVLQHTNRAARIVPTNSLANDPRGAQAGGPTTLLAADLTAVIDTGAQACAIDPLLADRYRLSVIRNDEVTGATGSVTGRVFNGQLFFFETATMHEVELTEVPMRSAGFAFDIIIGWALLRLFDLRISRRRNLVELDEP